MNSTTAQELFGAIVSDVVAKQSEVADAQVADIKKRISVPVDRRGSTVIRSKPGEPPRKDTGALYESIEQFTADSFTTIETVISTDRVYGPILEAQLNRPIMFDWHETYLNQYLDASVRGINGD